MRSLATMASFCVILLGERAAAQPAAPSSGTPPAAASPGDPTESGDKPWARGVTSEQRQTAEQLLAEGNALFVESKHREALAKYRAALASWDHPAIRFNIARALINLERPVDAYENIQLALRFGRAPIPEVYDEAKNYESLLRGQIAEITVSCSQAGVNVAVDGQQYLTCPGTRTVELLPGPHKVLAEKQGFLTFSRDLSLLPAAKETVEVTLLTLEDAAITRRRWDVWKPWAVTGGGAALAGVGLLIELRARATRAGYAEDLGGLCSEVACNPDELPDSVRGAWGQAKIEHALGVSTLAVGAAAVLSGLTLVILNRPRTFLPEQSAPSGMQVVPSVSADAVSAALIYRF